MGKWKEDKPGNWEPGQFAWDNEEADMIQDRKEEIRTRVKFQQLSGIDV